MKISFDLDDTLITGSKTFKTEPRSLLQKLLGLEFIRTGTISLFKELRKQGHVVGIYTTSFRSNIYIKLLFVLNGFSPDFIINQKLNLRELDKGQIRSSKYPPAFGIDLHIDDSRGVEMEGQRYGFETIIIDEHEPDWTGKVLRELLLYSHVK